MTAYSLPDIGITLTRFLSSKGEKKYRGTFFHFALSQKYPIPTKMYVVQLDLRLFLPDLFDSLAAVI